MARKIAGPGQRAVCVAVDSSSELNSASRLGAFVIASTALPPTFRDRLKQHLKPCASGPTFCSLQRLPTSINSRCKSSHSHSGS